MLQTPEFMNGNCMVKMVKYQTHRTPKQILLAIPTLPVQVMLVMELGLLLMVVLPHFGEVMQ
jgi:hypothetical protein